MKPMKEQLGLVVLLSLYSRTYALTARPAGLWRNPVDRELWYELGKAHWEKAQATNDGVTSGIGPLHDIDIADSRHFLTAGEAPLWPSPLFRAGARALDIGAGIGRVSDALLLNLCGEVDLVDGSAAYLEQARASLGGERDSPPAATATRGRLGELVCSELQSFVPLPSYDLVWIQWTTMYLTDDDLKRLLVDCQRALAPGGLIVLKDNVIDGPGEHLTEGKYLIDHDDNSVIRTMVSLEAILYARAGLKLLARAEAILGRDDLHPVFNIALRPSD